jgi:hypothetical protein
MGGILQQKSATFVWELMFTRSLFQTYDMIEQHHLLNTVADLIDSKKIKTTLTDLFTPINAENLRTQEAGIWYYDWEDCFIWLLDLTTFPILLTTFRT